MTNVQADPRSYYRYVKKWEHEFVQGKSVITDSFAQKFFS